MSLFFNLSFVEESRLRQKDCSYFARKGCRQNGLYKVTINGKKVEVYCDLQTDGGNWTVSNRYKLNHGANFMIVTKPRILRNRLFNVDKMAVWIFIETGRIMWKDSGTKPENSG